MLVVVSEVVSLASPQPLGSPWPQFEDGAPRAEAIALPSSRPAEVIPNEVGELGRVAEDIETSRPLSEKYG